MEVNIVSYNILADCYIRVPDQPWNSFSNCDDDSLDLDLRTHKILESLLRSNADIICLQEVSFEKRDNIWGLPKWTDELVQRGYTGVMQFTNQKDMDKQSARNMELTGKSTPTGVASFYLNSKFEETNKTQHGSGSGVTLFLRHKIANSTIHINNIHLVSRKDKFEFHCNQLEGALRQFNKSATSGDIQIICGDFNNDVTSECDVSRWFSRELFERIPTGFSWMYDCKHLRLDHIMIRSTKEMLYKNVFPKDQVLFDNLPNFEQPSDHLMIGVTILL